MLVVLGSINMDLTTVADEIPKPGETVIGESFAHYAGGKGANQAVCAAKLRSDVCFLGKVGNDSYGDFMLAAMAESGVDVRRVEKCGVSTGIAAISVDRYGRNSIIVVPGANFLVDRAYIDRNKDVLSRCNILLAQHETPITSTEYAFEMAKKANPSTVTILNPAPAADISDKMITLTDLLVPNEHELSRITGLPSDSPAEIAAAATVLREKGVKAVIVTMGEKGVFLSSDGGELSFPAYQIIPVDTTAAGDSFLGGLATALEKENDLVKAIAFGQTVASYAVQHMGAQKSMPSAEQFAAYQKNLPPLSI